MSNRRKRCPWYCFGCDICKNAPVVTVRESWGGEPTGECTIFCGKNCSHIRRKRRKR